MTLLVGSYPPIVICVRVRSGVEPACPAVNGDIRASSELLLWSAAYPLRTIVTPPPGVPCEISPLQHTQLAGHPSGELVPQPVPPILLWGGWVEFLPAVLLAHHVLVQAGLGGGPGGRVQGTHAEFKESFVICSQLYLNVNHLILYVSFCNDSESKGSTHLVGSGLGQVVGISAHTAETIILVPLLSKPSAVSLVIIHILRCLEVISPHGGPAWGLP